MVKRREDGFTSLKEGQSGELNLQEEEMVVSSKSLMDNRPIPSYKKDHKILDPKKEGSGRDDCH